MEGIEKRLFDDFCIFFYYECQHEYKIYEGRQAPLTLEEYKKKNYTFLLEKWAINRSAWYSKGEVS